MKANFQLSHKFFLSTALATTLSYSAPVAATPLPSDTIKAQGGTIRITPKFHGSFQITYAGKVFEIDPVSAASYTQKADYILITHAHPDHFDMAAIKKLVRSGPDFVTSEGTGTTTTSVSTGGGGTTILAPEAIAKQLQSKVKSAVCSAMTNATRMTEEESVPGERRTRKVLEIEAVPMYNVVHERAKGKKFHPKGEGNGYILTLGGKRIYIAGDTEATPEMRKLKNIDIAFLPMNLPFTMTSQEAAKGARAFKPKIVYPYHYRYPFNKANNNPQQFAAALKGSGIQVRIRNRYPAAAVARATAAAKK